MQWIRRSVFRLEVEEFSLSVLNDPFALHLNIIELESFFNVCHPVVLLSITITTISVQTQLDSICYVELHVLIHLGLSSGSQLVSQCF